MGLPALRKETEPARRRTPLAVVDTRPPSRTAGKRGSKAREHAKCRSLFRTFVVFAVLFSALGVVRVALAAHATAISLESGELRKEIKKARLQGDTLEIRLSALSNGSRIRWYADKKMGMAEGGPVWYMTIDGSEAPPAPRAADPAPHPNLASAPEAPGRARSGLLSAIMNTAAGEAQALLLGDVGIASSR